MKPLALSIAMLCVFPAFADDPLGQPTPGAAAKAAPAKPAKMEAVFGEGTLTVNGTEIKMGGDPEAVVKLLGKPDRVAKLANTISTWDNLGICLYVNPESGKITELNFSLQKEGFEFSPAKTYAGNITVNGVKIDADSTPADLNRAKRGKPFDEVAAGSSDWWKADYGASIFFAGTVKGGKTLAYINICKSVGN